MNGPKRSDARVVTLLTCHDRRDSTLRCLESLFRQRTAPSAVVLVDDGSSDGTAEEVARRFPEVVIVPGSGSLYWGGGMRLATEVASSRFDAEFHLWLNDDVVLSADAVEMLLDTYRARRDAGRPRSLVVGALRDPSTGATSYSGLKRANPWHRLRFALVEPSGEPQLCDTLNGNVVLLPVEAISSLGTIDPLFTHNIGDTDYGLRARKAGWDVVLAPGYTGTCSPNPPTGTFAEPTLPLRARFRLFSSAKGLPFRAWATYTRRHGGLLWPAYLALPYLGIILSALPFFRKRYLKRKGFSAPA